MELSTVESPQDTSAGLRAIWEAGMNFGCWPGVNDGRTECGQLTPMCMTPFGNRKLVVMADFGARGG